MPCPVIWVYVNAHWNTKLVFNPMPVHSGTVMSCCYPALMLELAWYIWVTNSRYEHGAKFRWTQHRLPWKQELTPSCDLGSVYETVYLYEWYLQNVLVYGRTWYIWIVVIISEYWDWNWTTCMETNERFWSACKQSRFILMRLHHMLWCGVIGEDYDEFEGIRTSTCLSFESKLTMIFVFFNDFPSFPNEGLRGLYWMVHNYDDFLSEYFPNGVSGFIFQCAIQDGILSIGIPYWLEGSVWWYCWWVTSLTADCEGQTMYVRYMCVSSRAPCARSHNNPTK